MQVVEITELLLECLQASKRGMDIALGDSERV